MLTSAFDLDRQNESKNAMIESVKTSNKFAQFKKAIAKRKLAEYDHWEVYLDQKQYYLGRVFILAKRDGAVDLNSLSMDEWIEFKQVSADVDVLFTNTFKPDLLNHAFLGNEMQHCHCHVVPRYKEPREFLGITFKDENFGKNYSRENARDFRISGTVLEKIAEKMQEEMKLILEAKQTSPYPQLRITKPGTI